MKVVFLEDVPRIAKAGAIKEVADGYARNYLIPRKLAVLANNSAVGLAEAQRKAREKQENETRARMLDLAQQLEAKEVTLTAKAGGKEKLYGSITTADIAAALEALGLAIDKRKIDLAEPIHQLGTYHVPVKLAGDIIPTIMVTVKEAEAA